MPVVIGSQSDVPNAGDPIVSPWYQDTAKKIVHVFSTTTARDAWVSPPDGAVCEAPAGVFFKRVAGLWAPLVPAAGDFQHPGNTTYGTGLYDLGTTTLGPYTYPVQMSVTVAVYFGAATGVVTAITYLTRLSDGATRQPGNGGFFDAPANRWMSAPNNWTWNVNAGQSASFKTQVNFITIASGQASANAVGTYRIQHVG
jgi:hypothetical protein